MSSPIPASVPLAQPSAGSRDNALEHVAAALKGLQFGMVSVIVQDGVVIQVERTERVRVRNKQQR